MEMIIGLEVVARLVSGHPMEAEQQTDDNNQPKFNAAGEPKMNTYVGLAIPKGTEQTWQQTAWGQQIVAQAAADWPNGEYRAPAFAWKIKDGDDSIPNKKGKKNCDNEGWVGHWVIFASSSFMVNCFHRGRFAPHEQIQNKAEIKRGDYVQLIVDIKGNGPVCQSPGIYINPKAFVLYQAGQEIKGSTVDVQAAFAGLAASTMPTGAVIDSSVPAVQQPVVPQVQQQVAPIAPQVQQPVVPATDLVQPGAQIAPPIAPPVVAAPPVVESYQMADGSVHTRDALLAMPGWTEAHLAGLVKV